MPEFRTVGVKIKKAKRSHDPDAQIIGKPDSSNPCGEIATTPEFPELKSQYLKQMVTAKKVRGAFSQRQI